MTVPKIISIEGNIGAGKTTFISNLEKYYKNDSSVIFIREPVDIWQSITDSKGESILAKFYADPAKYSFSFQVMAFVTRLSMLRNTIKENPNCEIIVCERSLEADRNIFAKMLYDDGLIDEINYKIYLKFYSEYRDEFELYGIVYLNTYAKVCYDRVKKRSREGEESVSLNYLEKCKKYHEEWLCDTENILIIDANEDVKYDFDDIHDKSNEWLEKIKQYIYDIKNDGNSTTTTDDIDDGYDIQEYDKTNIWHNLISKFMEKI
jgi:deoxyadenosine/deoxycytidine kinase